MGRCGECGRDYYRFFADEDVCRRCREARERPRFPRLLVPDGDDPDPADLYQDTGGEG